jgi:2-keto-4-pentenoate hydratase/2-oxohepta-3-ene-1,7-dioic acid hydratase in catechol pathway
MQLANVGGRAALVLGDEVADLETVSDGHFGPDPMAAYGRWDELVDFAPTVASGTGVLVEAELRCPIPRPRHVFAIGLNYRSHAEESGIPVPEVPATFTKFPGCLAGPFDDVELPNGSVDWEVELVAVIGAPADRVDESDGWAHVAGLAVGQDLSDRDLQFAAAGQFSLGKSWRGFGPIGPWVTSAHDLADRDRLALGCAVDGDVVQEGRTDDLVFSVPRLVAELSAVLPLDAGDVIFTGTPAGVGFTRRPPRFLRPGQVLESWIEGLGTIRNRCT